MPSSSVILFVSLAIACALGIVVGTQRRLRGDRSIRRDGIAGREGRKIGWDQIRRTEEVWVTDGESGYNCFRGYLAGDTVAFSIDDRRPGYRARKRQIEKRIQETKGRSCSDSPPESRLPRS